MNLKRDSASTAGEENAHSINRNAMTVAQEIITNGEHEYKLLDKVEKEFGGSQQRRPNN
jgi:hypothetical protein